MNNPSLDDHVKQTIQVGSKSFAAASALFDPPTRRSVLMLYAWCRHCDDTIDDQVLGFQAKQPQSTMIEQRLADLRKQTTAAFIGETPLTPAFSALRQVIVTHQLSQQFAFEHLDGYAMDVAQARYQTIEQTLCYCYHVAGVVGLMMAQIMGAKSHDVLDRACDLGIAFQLTNIARDIIDDADMDRCYLPEQWLAEEGLTRENYAQPQHRSALSRVAAKLVDHAEPYYHSSYQGLRALPFRSAWAVATARRVYRKIGQRVKQAGAGAWQQRLSTSRGEKLVLLVAAVGDVLLSRIMPITRRDASLWQRPQ
ncbi:phytoene/squalene synthase family protein [Rosenbergiella australiborealis]|uniref:Phytoene/squalene synthase family protein n=1 Tax=Rosenbergiella australiborealis TaxID=1544696 RepID=A0ABS5T488_9GAMM|nr:phytoene/squalene synthase family protein [Rosenbergiella australiborealis]MBT0727161.1 phytoene/squalene synthase family protein [Rosenbergiella australiborealis]